SQPGSQPIEMSVLRLLDDAPRSTLDIAQALGKSKPSRHVRDVVRRLVAAGDIAYLVPDRPRSRFQQYRLTEQGLRRIGRG
ncbi:MAG: hypothetical protein Q4E06_04495, partial [Lautropia sp.]|nr:hypothetical protein [Lautropia sp.]